MRLALIFWVVAASPAAAWEFTAIPICTLSNSTEAADIRVIYDPGRSVYAISITRRDAPWTPGPAFAIRFDGPQALAISTARHVLSDGNSTLTVTDSGFGNVLNGLEFNRSATALLGDSAIEIPLVGAARQVQKFRACAEAPLA